MIHPFCYCYICKEERPITYNWEQKYWECIFCHFPIRTPEEEIYQVKSQSEKVKVREGERK